MAVIGDDRCVSDDQPRPARPDTRFVLANERTLLAWIRTALALLASAGAVHQFTDVSGRTAIAVCLALAGIGTAVAGGSRYLATSSAMRAGVEPPTARSPVVLAAAVTVIGAALLVALLVS